MGTVPMLCPYKIMFSGLIPYLGEERAGQRPSTRVTSPGDTAQGVTLLWPQHPAQLPGVGWGEWDSVPPAFPQLLEAGPKAAACTPGRTRQQPGLSCQMSWGGGVKVHPCQEQGYERVRGPPDRSRMGQPLVPGARCEPGLAAGRAEEAEPVAGLHLEPGWGTRAEHSQGRAWEQQDGEHSLCRCPQARSYPCSTPAPPGPLACSSCSCFPATPSRYEWPRFPLWDISCFPDCWPAGFSWMSCLPPARRPTHRVRSACHAASMSE